MNSRPIQCKQKTKDFYGVANCFIILATYIMTYRKVLKTSQDFYESLEKSRQLSEQLTRKLQSDGNTDAIVRSYSYPDVFYEQYLTMWRDTTKSLLLSIFAIFVVMYLFLGLDLYSATIIALTIVIILINLMGLMYWWDISLNAISLVNLVVVSYFISTFSDNDLKSLNNL